MSSTASCPGRGRNHDHLARGRCRGVTHPAREGDAAAMAAHKIGTRDEWLAARLELLEAEKELTRRGDELARRRRDLPWVLVEKDYRFATEDGDASLRELFGGRSQLLVYHFMLDPGLGRRLSELLGGCRRLRWQHRAPRAPRCRVRRGVAGAARRTRSVQASHGMGRPLGLVVRQQLQLRLPRDDRSRRWRRSSTTTRTRRNSRRRTSPGATGRASSPA